MVKYSYAERVVSKIQHLTREDARLNMIVAQPFKVVLNDRCELETIEWQYEDQTVIAHANVLMYFDKHGQHIPMLAYDGFDSLLTK